MIIQFEDLLAQPKRAVDQILTHCDLDESSPEIFIRDQSADDMQSRHSTSSNSGQGKFEREATEEQQEMAQKFSEKLADIGYQ